LSRVEAAHGFSEQQKKTARGQAGIPKNWILGSSASMRPQQAARESGWTKEEMEWDGGLLGMG